MKIVKRMALIPVVLLVACGAWNSYEKVDKLVKVYQAACFL
jgi:hypothetical protein